MKHLTMNVPAIRFFIAFISIAFLFVFFQAAPIGAQESAAGGTAESERIPRRLLLIYSASGPVAPDDETFLSSLDEYVFTTLSSRQPVVRVENPERAHNRLSVHVAGGTDTYTVEVVLEEKQRQSGAEAGAEMWSERFVDETEFRGDQEALQRFIESTAEEMSEYLGMVKPEIRINVRVKDEGTRRMVEEIDFADRLNTPFELTAWLFHMTSDFTFGDGMEIGYRFNVLPVSLDAAWFPSREHGLVGTLFYDYLDATGDGLENSVIVPGLGYRFRLLDRISASFSIGYSAGAALGEQMRFMNFFWMFPAVTWNITEQLGLAYRLGFYVDPVLMLPDIGNYEPAAADSMLIQYVSLGFVYHLGEPRN